MKIYVFERQDGSRYVKQFRTVEEAQQHATDNNETMVPRT